MNRTSLMIIGGALVVAIILGLVAQSLSSKKTEVATTGTEVLVASKELPTGEVLKAENSHWENLPDNAVYKGMIKRKDQADDKKLEVYGKPLRREVQFGEPITMQALIDAAGSGNYLAAALHPGMRAV